MTDCARAKTTLLFMMCTAGPVAAQCVGDADRNGFINFSDFGAVSQQFGQSCAAQPYCGNAVVESSEKCDQGNLNGATCVTEGFEAGELACGADCAFDTSGCFLNRFIDNSDGTISDRLTGLMWAKQYDDASVFDKDYVYSWGSAERPYLADGTVFTVYLATLNGAFGSCFAGYCDWRLPTYAELLGLRDEDEVGPKIDNLFKGNCKAGCSGPAFCSCTATHLGYWTGVTFLGSGDVAWHALAHWVDFGYLDPPHWGTAYKDELKSARAVRSGP